MFVKGNFLSGVLVMILISLSLSLSAFWVHTLTFLGQKGNAKSHQAKICCDSMRKHFIFALMLSFQIEFQRNVVREKRKKRSSFVRLQFNYYEARRWRRRTRRPNSGLCRLATTFTNAFTAVHSGKTYLGCDKQGKLFQNTLQSGKCISKWGKTD